MTFTPPARPLRSWSARWQATQAYTRALIVVVVGVLLAVLLRRPDLIVLVSPFIAILVWSILTKPTAQPHVRLRLQQSVASEGQRATVVAVIDNPAGADLASVSLARSRWTTLQPDHGALIRAIPADVHTSPDAGTAATATATPRSTIRLPLGVTGDRWGIRRVGPALAGLLGPWGSYRWGPEHTDSLDLQVTPQPVQFDSSAPAPHPRGLVGLHRSARRGDGSEFRDIRPFQWGDRLKRIHWTRSLRAGELHVTSSYSEEDTHVAIIVDAHFDLGRSGGVDGPASTLDISVRAAAAVAEHFLHQGDRVGLQVWSSRTPLRSRVGTGRQHLYRVQDLLSRIQPGVQEERSRRMRWNLRPGTLVVVVSALVSPVALAEAGILARSGLSVVVIDAMVDGVDSGQEKDPGGAVAWRIRLLERDREIRRVQREGVAVVPWRGPGSLDVVLRQLATQRTGGVRR